ncbi:Bifunctional pinoresinol-lariciresinol reductase 2 [Colletotrichum siamense]|nr:Bifunctional pinoresinol-lariciresinol reductase 2 [Colletotrichum siamense]
MASVSQEIRNVAVVGGSGLLGSLISKELIQSGLFNVTILSRGQGVDAGLGANLAIVDYNNEESLVKALAGQDAVVSALSREAIPLQIPLIDAAATAGVKRFIPSEFGSNLQDPQIRTFPNYKHKVQVEEYLEQKARSHGITYTYIYNNVFIDLSIETGVVLDLKERKARLYNRGERAVSMITMPTAARAVVAVLKHSAETKNRPVFIHEGRMSQKQILGHAKEVISEGEWHEEQVHLEELEKHLAAQATVDGSKMGVFHVYAVKGAFGDGLGNQYSETDNQLLGIQPLSEEGFKEMLADIIAKKAEANIRPVQKS